MLVTVIGALVALAAVEPAQVAPAAPAASTVAADALALAKLMAPRDLRIQGELRQFDLNFAKTLMQNEDIKDVEGEYPGTVDAMARAVRPLLAQEAGKIADGAYPEIARVLAGELTGPDIAELTAYYGSPAGQNMLRRIVDSMDASSLYAEAMKNDGKVSDEAATAETFIAALKASSQVSTSDRDTLKALMQRPVWPKLRAMQPKIAKILIDATNAPDPAYDKQVEEVMTSAAEAHVKSLRPRAKPEQ